ncbi:MAG: hypothetical protein JNL79_40710 [Myxococcales bacterium]|nr:hypothetical protein [Myxococcales bacterium]
MAARDGFRFWQFGSGRLWIRSSGPAIEAVVEGYLDVTLNDAYIRAFDEAMDAFPRRVGFHDWERLHGYDPRAREAWQRWLPMRGDNLDEVTFLTRLRLVRMGIVVANLAYPRIQFRVCTSLAEYLGRSDRWLPRVARPYESGFETAPTLRPRATTWAGAPSPTDHGCDLHRAQPPSGRAYTKPGGVTR